MKKSGSIKLFCMLMALCTLLLCQAGNASAYTATPRTVITSSKNTLSGGRWIVSSQGKRYMIHHSYVRNKWCRIGGKVYYFDPNGYVKKGLFRYGNEYYFAAKNGAVVHHRWISIDNEKWFFTDEGYRARRARWYKIDGNKYFFSRDNAYLITSSWVDNRYVDEKGKMVKASTVDGRKINNKGDIETLSSRDKYIIVGASRIQDMSYSVDTRNTVFIAKAGEGLEWFKSYALPVLESYLINKPECKVIFQLGNNDRENVNAYIKLYKIIIAKYPKTSFFFLDATPGRTEYANASRRAFNKKMKAAFGKRCIGGYDYLLSHLQAINFNMPDNIHYYPETSRKLYRYIINAVKDK